MARKFFLLSKRKKEKIEESIINNENESLNKEIINEPSTETDENVVVVPSEKVKFVKKITLKKEIEQKPISDEMLLKLKMASDKVCHFYSIFRNEISKGKNVRFKTTKTDNYYYKGKRIIRVVVLKRCLKIYFDLNPEDYDPRIYHHQNVKETKKYENTPFLLKVKSPRFCKYAVELWHELAKKLNITCQEVEFVDYKKDLVSTSSEVLELLNKGELFKKTCALKNADVMNKSLATKATMLETDTDYPKTKKIASITIGELSAAFSKDYVIDLALLKETKVIEDKDANYLYVTNSNNCYHSITVKAHKFDDEALKMILITKGNAIKLIK